jgi:hypothetical protein
MVRSHSSYFKGHLSVSQLADVVYISESGLNPYNMRIPCNPDENGPDCYAQIQWTQTFMDKPETKLALGVDLHRPFFQCEPFIGERTRRNGQWMRDSSRLIPALVDEGVRALVYNGNAGEDCAQIFQARDSCQLIQTSCATTWSVFLPFVKR